MDEFIYDIRGNSQQMRLEDIFQNFIKSQDEEFMDLMVKNENQKKLRGSLSKSTYNLKRKLKSNLPELEF